MAMADFVRSLVTKTAGKEAQPAGAEEKRKELVKRWKELVKMGKETSESEAGDRGLKEKEANPPEEFGILEKKRLMIGCKALLKSHMAEVEGEAQAAEPRKKRTKVMKKVVPRGAIEVMKAMPIERIELTEECLLYSSLGALLFSEWNNAKADYEQALVRQYDVQGRAVDETDVTDDEEEMVEN